jgi:hypothetical protein
MSHDLFGLNLRDFVIGMQGAISGIVVLRTIKPRDILGSLAAGGFTANYCWAAIGGIFGTPHDMSVYIAGVAGLTICLLIITAVETLGAGIIGKLKND